MGWFGDNMAQQQHPGRGGSIDATVTPDVRMLGGGTPTGGGSISDPEAYIRQRQAQLPASPASLEQIYNELIAAGVQVERPTHAGGTKVSDDKLVLPGGKVIDMITGVDGGNPGWSMQSAGYWNDGKAYDDPNFQIRSGSNNGGPGGFSTSGANNLASFGAPGILAPFTQQFQAPTGTDDPGFKFAMDQGFEALDRSKAAQGTLLTGGAIKDAVGFATGMANQYYGDAWNRAKNVYDTNRGTFWGNQDNAYSKLAGAAGMGAGASNNLANIYAGGANANAATTVAQNNNTNSTFANLADFGLSAYDRWKNRNKQPQAAGA